MESRYKRVETAWWCSEHQEIHNGDLERDFNMEHRMHLHPVYFYDRGES